MSDFIIYLLKASIWLILFFSVYYFFLRKETFFEFNRYFLLFGLIASAVFPLLIFHYTTNTEPIAVYPIRVMENTIIVEGGRLELWIIRVYCMGFGLRVLLHIIGFVRFMSFISKQEIIRQGKLKLIVSGKQIAPYSIFNFVILNSSLPTQESKIVLEHERAHIEQFHWVDLLLMEIHRTIFWFSPFGSIYSRFLKQNHEYLADKCVLTEGNSRANYRATLLNQSLGGSVFSLANSFSTSVIKERFKMMEKPYSSNTRKWSVLLLIPILLLSLYYFSEPLYTKSNQPIYIIDNVEYSSIDGFNTDNIESISVLKNKSATDYYGEKGKNGVILITTKKK